MPPSMAGPAPEMMPAHIDRYEVRAFLGRRGRLHVYRVFDPRLTRDLAITIMAPHYEIEPELKAHFREEVARLAALDHAAIAPVYDSGEWRGYPYMVLPFLAGGTLTAVRMAGELLLKDILHCTERVAAALNAAHAQGVAHGRVQPSNIIFNEVGEAFLTGFASTLAPPALDSAYSDRGLRTAHFVSPEQAMALLDGAPAPGTPATDVYSLGAVLYFALTGEPPFPGDDPRTICEAHLNLPRPTLSPRHRVPTAVQAVLHRALAKDPAERYPDPVTMANHLHDTATGRWYWQSLDVSAKDRDAARPASRPATTGQRLGRYELASIVGRGSMGVVFHAYDPDIDRAVALKVLPERLVRSAHFLQRFKQEAELVASLQHPAIVPVYDLGVAEGRPFLVMPFLEGGTLADRLSDGPLTPSIIVPIIERVAAALSATHAHDIIHRDVKPANILFDGKGEAHLADFGIALLQTETGEPDVAGGTPKYMSPEQVTAFVERRTDTIDARSDVYSLGVVLYHMLAGQAPFHEGSAAAIAQAQLKSAPPPLTGRHRADPFPDIVTRALAKDPAERYQTAIELAEAVREGAGGGWLLEKLG